MNKEQKSGGRDLILELSKAYAHEVYKLSKALPKHELFGITSQITRASLSVPLNIVEGHARGTNNNRLNFCRIAYGSLKECQFLILFCVEEGFFTENNIAMTYQKGDKLAAMLWKKIKALENKK